MGYCKLGLIANFSEGFKLKVKTLFLKYMLGIWQEFWFIRILEDCGYQIYRWLYHYIDWILARYVLGEHWCYCTAVIRIQHLSNLNLISGHKLSICYITTIASFIFGVLSHLGGVLSQGKAYIFSLVINLYFWHDLFFDQ